MRCILEIYRILFGQAGANLFEEFVEVRITEKMRFMSFFFICVVIVCAISVGYVALIRRVRLRA